jgi:AcrR family transcriptional regulator
MAGEGPKRQERGKRRIESILDAASVAFAEVGYDGASTNRIAATAGISPGSLYQFFANKQAIAEALTARYVADMHALYESALDPRQASLPLPEMIDRVVDEMVAFHLANPAAKALLAGADISAELAAATESLHTAMCGRVEDLIAAAAPGLPPDDLTRTAEVAVQITKALLPMVLAAPAAERGAVIAELKRALVGYLRTTVPAGD